MKKKLLLTMVGIAFVLAACGNDDGGESNSDDIVLDENAESEVADGDDESSVDGSGFELVDPAPPGQATASVDGLDLTFELPGALACAISDDSITFSHRIGDNEVTLGAGINRVDEGWMGSIALTIANPEGEAGPIAYYLEPGQLGILDESLFAVDGESMSYSGPMLKQPANDGSLPPPVDVGTGTISATCG